MYFQRPHATYDSGEELLLGTCDSVGVGGVAALVNTHLSMNINLYESHHLNGAMWLRISFDCVELEKFYKEDNSLYKVIVDDFNAKIGPRRPPDGLHIGTHGLEWNEQGERLSEFIRREYRKIKKRSPRKTINWDLYTSLAGLWEDTVIDNIDEKYDRFRAPSPR
ncbi:unnamed protein product [Heligmosomoides polygyrus]|uniref:Endo/exonuclease/phosphatase domain-containing protein n=1 Tax=Heligmosomoides polygyrus TaxID=6339 RepID=A0A183G2P3_HELPZ|nr:unnamed protein product [Heligmosomoides polygyrus]